MSSNNITLDGNLSMSSNELSLSDNSTSSDYISQSNNLDLEGCILKTYNIICELGRGGFSIVWLAYSISNNIFVALKVQNPDEYKDGLSEITFVENLSKNKHTNFINLIEYFVEIKDKNKYLCSVWELHATNLDCLLRKGDYKTGFEFSIIRNIMLQIIEGLKILHNKYKVYHGDIKTDNILVKGVSKKNQYIIDNYLEQNFNERYNKLKEEQWLQTGKTLDTIKNMKKEIKYKIRSKLHKEINDIVLSKLEQVDISPYDIDEKYINNIKISISDFGTFCGQDDYYDDVFGTRYYYAPEVILGGKCSYSVDIWCLGCLLFELLTGDILFDPIKDSEYNRDYYHLCLINDTCGDFPKIFLKTTKYYKKYFNLNYKIKDYKYEENRLERKLKVRKYYSDEYKYIYSLLKIYLSIDPSKRELVF